MIKVRKQERWWREVDTHNKLLFHPPPGALRLPSGGSEPEMTDGLCRPTTAPLHTPAHGPGLKITVGIRVLTAACLTAPTGFHRKKKGGGAALWLRRLQGMFQESHQPGSPESAARGQKRKHEALSICGLSSWTFL